jgi:ferredoxin
MGAVLGLSNIFRIFGIRREKASCIDCKLCDRVCPMNIEVSGKGRILDHQCISCGECTSDRECPVALTVDWTLIGTALKAGTDAAKIEGGKE